MTLTIDLSPAEEARLKVAARQKGLAPSALAKQLVAEHLPVEDPTLALFAQWAEEAKAMTPEEREQEQRLWEQFEIGINETREASGMRLLFQTPDVTR